MKILVISHMYPSPSNPTNGIFVHEQVKALIQQGCEVKVISPVPYAPFPLGLINEKWNRYANIPKQAVIDGVEIFYPRYLEFPGAMFYEYSSHLMYLGIKNTVKKVFNDFKFDIIHSHVAFPDGYASLLVNHSYKVPHTVTIHGQDLQLTIFLNEKLKNRVFHVLNKVDKVITVSSKLKNVLINENVYRNVVIINNGINLKDYQSLSTFKPKEYTPDQVIVSASNLLEAKGIDLNIKAVSLLVKKHPHIKYMIIGDGPDKQRLMNLVDELKLNEHVIFKGKLPHNEVIECMYRSTIFSLPSWREGFGIVYLEAMACGKPVIAVKGEGIDGIIINGENGYLVERHNYEKLAQVLDHLLCHSKEANLIAQKGKRDILENYTWDINAKKTIHVYQQISVENMEEKVGIPLRVR